MYWVDTPSGRHCNRHGEDFGRGDSCRQCLVDPGDPIEVGVEKPRDLEGEALEREVLNYARAAKRLSEELSDLSERTAKEAAVGAKWADVYLKAIRLWREMREPRLEREHDEKLCEHDAKIAATRGAH